MFKELLEDIDAYYGLPARKEFYQKMVEGGYAPLFSLPLIEGGTKARTKRVAIDQLTSGTVASFRICNPSSEPASFNARADFSRCTDLGALFKAFSDVTHNVITLGDFRDSPAYYARIFSDSTYFLFHGDGFCHSLGFLFQGLAKKLLDVDVDLRYCRTPDGGYTHVYGLSGEWFVDPALKSFYPVHELRDRIPYAWFYTLLKRVGMLAWSRIPESDRKWMFSAATRRHMDIMNSGNFQLVYRSDARLQNVFPVFLETVEKYSEPISVARDDFPWKRRYRDQALRYGGRDDLYFFSRLEQTVDLELPPGSTFELPDSASVRPLFRALMTVFYGRVFARLVVCANADGRISLRLPDLPWLIEDPTGLLREIQLNSGVARFCRTQLAPGAGFIGLERIDALVNIADGPFQLDMRVVPGAEIRLHVPLNALFWNSPYLELHPSRNGKGLETEAEFS